MFEIIKLDSKTIDIINSILESNKFKNCSEGTHTVNGFQTDNIVDIFSKKILKKMIPYKDFYNRVFHIHYINYFEGGHQETHNHSKTERFSFILYLNDSDGETFFEEPIFKKIKPTKGLLVLFKADILHCAEKSFNNKKILVGAIDRI